MANAHAATPPSSRWEGSYGRATFIPILVGGGGVEQLRWMLFRVSSSEDLARCRPSGGGDPVRRERGVRGTVGGSPGTRAPPPTRTRVNSVQLLLLLLCIWISGEVFITWFGPVPRVIITKPELVHKVLSNKFGHFEKFMFSDVLKMLHNGVSSQEGEKWAKHRRIINPAFHLEKLKRMLPAFATCCAELVDGWESLAASDDDPVEVDVWPEMQRLAGDVISRAAFGSSYLEGRKIFELQGEQAKLTVLVLNKIYFPGYLSLPTRLNRRRKQIAGAVEGILKGLIAKREDDLRTGQGTSDDLLGLLLESNMAHGGGGLTTDEVIGECKLFYFAGTETTSALLTWTMVVLCMHPEWQHRAREEVLQVFDTSSIPDYDDLNRLRTVSMVLYEVLRLYSPITSIHRRTYKPMELDGIKYPAGVMLTIPVLCIHHDSDVWGPDVNEFRPERFAEGISKATASESGNAPAPFFPFGGGPRVCVGQNFALLEAKMGLTMILRRFSLELSPAYKHTPFPMGMLQPEHGAQIKLRRLH